MERNKIILFLTSLKLTVVCLSLGIVLVFLGTLAQVSEGLYIAQNRWFRSFFIWWGPTGAAWQIPIFPGGYLVGTVLVVNLVLTHIKRFQLTWKKLGIHVTHVGIILLLLGQLATDLLSRETQMSFAEGESRHYSSSSMSTEIAFVTNCENPDEEEVVAIPQSVLAEKGEIRHEKLPFIVRVEQLHINSRVRQRAPMMDTNPPPATAGYGPKITLVPVPETRTTDERNLPAAVLELVGPQGSLGTWVGQVTLDEQEVKVGDRSWRMSLRFEREYHRFSVQLLKTTHEVYPGTRSSANPQGIPKNFQSRVRIENPKTRESREVDIYMNNPLRYEGLTFYQYQMGSDELDRNRGTSVLQVVRNPSWLTPYLACVLVGGGLVIQFMMHLAGFIKKRRIA
ncbi:MAG: ResB protein required for cytochrome C biosynthesis [Verrucomicrobia bacterium]|nr:ResB protein required for cytochrome C biosynthesis [Verrucomicrobiota bacterium]